MKRSDKVLALFALFLQISCGTQQQTDLLTSSKLSDTVIIKEVNVFNGKDEQLEFGQDIRIESGIITALGPNLSIPANAQVIEGKGKTVLPGLIDAHVHLSGSGAVPWANQSADVARNLSAYLYAGVTTVYDLGGLGNDLEKAVEKVNQQKWLGPTIYHTHIPITVKNSHPIPLTEVMLPWPLKKMVNALAPTIDQTEEAPDLIADYLKYQVDYVKVVCDQIPPGSPQMTYEQLKAVIDAAHAQDKKVFVHIGSPQNALTAIKAGADVLAHGVWRGKLTEAQADSIAQSRVPVIYTLAALQNVHHIHEGSYEPTKLDQYLVSEKVLGPVSGIRGKDVEQEPVMFHFFEDVTRHHPHLEHNFKLLLQKGARMHVGTDSNLPGTYAGSTYIQELQALQKWGMTPFEILKAATYGNAHLFLDQPDFGSIEVGKKADLLLVEGNPLENVATVTQLIEVIRDGQRIKKN